MAYYYAEYALSHLDNYMASTDIWKALHRASESHNEYHYILKSTVGVMFLGTPFQGSSKGFLTAVHLRLAVAVAMGGETADGLLNYLNNNENERRQLDDVVQQFCEMVASKSFNFPIRCFYETHRTDFSKIIHKLPAQYHAELGKDSAGIVSYIKKLVHIQQNR